MEAILEDTIPLLIMCKLVLTLGDDCVKGASFC